MAELEPAHLMEVPGVQRLSFNELNWHTRLQENTAETISDASEKADGLADEINELVSEADSINHEAVEENSLSNSNYVRLNEIIDELCDKRTEVLDALSDIEDGERMFDMLVNDSDSAPDSPMSDKEESIYGEVQMCSSSVKELYDVTDSSIETLASFIDQ